MVIIFSTLRNYRNDSLPTPFLVTPSYPKWKINNPYNSTFAKITLLNIIQHFFRIYFQKVSDIHTSILHLVNVEKSRII